MAEYWILIVSGTGSNFSLSIDNRTVSVPLGVFLLRTGHSLTLTLGSGEVLPTVYEAAA